MFRNNDIIANKKNISSVMLRFRTIALLIVTCSLLIVTCADPLERFYSDDSYKKSRDKAGGEPGALKPPAGMGYFSLDIEQSPRARTILPEWDVDYYTLAFTSVNGLYAPVNETFTQADADNGKPVLLNAGVWNLMVAAVNIKGEVSAAFLNGINIPSGGTTAGSVTLYPVAAAGTGVLEYDINLDGINNLSAAKMSVIPYTTGSENIYDIIAPANRKGSAHLPSGYYYIVIELEKDASEEKAPFYKEEILHIYQNLTSVYAPVFTDADFVNNYHTVTLVTNNGAADGVLKIPHGDLLSVADPPQIPAGAAVVRFRGWYEDDGTFAGKFDPAVTPVTRNMTLYADYGYRVGDTGPGGGIIYYRSEAGFVLDGYVDSVTGAPYTAHYLEAAPAGIQRGGRRLHRRAPTLLQMPQGGHTP